MKKNICLLLIVAALVSLFSCGEEERIKYDEQEVKLAAETLIRKSASLNKIFWGEGIKYVEDSEYASGYYYPADPSSLEQFGVDTVEQLKEKTEKVFSDKYCVSIFQSVFSSYGDEDVILGYSRYYQGDQTIMVYSKATPFLKDDVEYLFDTIAVVGSDKEAVYVELYVEITRGGSTQTRKLKVGIVKEEDGWKIDTPTYMTYRAEDSE